MRAHPGQQLEVAWLAIAPCEPREQAENLGVALGAEQGAAERERLSALLGGEAPLEVQNRALCRAIRAGEITLDTPGLREHLRATTLAKLAVDQPSYSGYRRAIE